MIVCIASTRLHGPWRPRLRRWVSLPFNTRDMKTKVVISLLSIVVLLAALTVQGLMVLVAYFTAWMPPDEVWAVPAERLVAYFSEQIDHLGLAAEGFALVNACFFIAYTIVINVLLLRRVSAFPSDSEKAKAEVKTVAKDDAKAEAKDEELPGGM